MNVEEYIAFCTVLQKLVAENIVPGDPFHALDLFILDELIF